MPHYRKNMEGTRYFANDDKDDPGVEAIGSWHLEDDQGRIHDMPVQIIKLPHGGAKVGIGKKAARKNVALVTTKSGRKWALVMGATMCKTVEKITGSADTDKWAGQWITLYRTTTNGQGGEEVFCIRIRPNAPKPAAETKPAGAKPTDQPEPEFSADDDGRAAGGAP